MSRSANHVCQPRPLPSRLAETRSPKPEAVNEDKSARYHRLKRRADVAERLWSVLMLVGLLATGLSGGLRDLVSTVAGGSSAAAVALYAGSLLLLHELGALPLAFLGGYRVDRRYGLSLEYYFDEPSSGVISARGYRRDISDFWGLVQIPPTAELRNAYGIDAATYTAAAGYLISTRLNGGCREISLLHGSIRIDRGQNSERRWGTRCILSKCIRLFKYCFSHFTSLSSHWLRFQLVDEPRICLGHLA